MNLHDKKTLAIGKAVEEVIEKDNKNLEENNHRDSSEMEMAQAEINKILDYSQKLSVMLPGLPSLEGWTASKITKSADYLSSVYHWLDYKSKNEE